IDPSKDKIIIDNKNIQKQEEKIYIKLYKPKGYISSCKRHTGERTVLDLIKNIPARLYPVGRLDKESEGLIILTNDGKLAHKLMHPRYEHEKEYEVTVEKELSDQEIKKLEDGIIIDGRKTLPTKLKTITNKKFNIILREGKKRQIRKMVSAVKNNVITLKRVRIENITLGTLSPGEYEYFSSKNFLTPKRNIIKQNLTDIV
ncbi:hypothetical protein A2526_02685, partial [candidate division WOR-1 bacterium RIFOXYD2_FULL_36_8]